MKFRASETFWTHFYDLSPAQKESARKAWKIFKANPFDPRLGAHKIHRLSSAFGRTVYGVEIEADLRVVFYLDGDIARTVDIGTHNIYET